MHLIDLCQDEVLLAIIRAYLYTPEEVLLLCTCEALFFLDYSFLADSRYNFHIFNVWQDQREEEEYYRSLSFLPLHSDSDPDTEWWSSYARRLLQFKAKLMERDAVIHGDGKGVSNVGVTKAKESAMIKDDLDGV
jgi:hypothetical protein